MDARLDPLQVTGGDHLGVDEVLDGSAGKVPDVVAGEDHGLKLRIAHRGALCTLSGGAVMRLALENRAAQVIGLSKL
jgi:hypothetical protein